jgi:predicted acyl esterase
MGVGVGLPIGFLLTIPDPRAAGTECATAGFLAVPRLGPGWREGEPPTRQVPLESPRKSRGTSNESPPRNQVVFSTRGDGVRFEWAVPEDIDVIGPMALRIDVELEGTDDAFLFVGVRKLHAGAERFFEGSYGFSYDMVTKGWQRIAHRELDTALSTPIQPVHTHRRAEKLAAGEIVTVDVALLPQATRLRRGDILALDIRGTWHFPQDPLRGQFPAAYQASPSGKCILHFGGSHARQLLLGHRPSAKG